MIPKINAIQLRQIIERVWPTLLCIIICLIVTYKDTLLRNYAIEHSVKVVEIKHKSLERCENDLCNKNYLFQKDPRQVLGVYGAFAQSWNPSQDSPGPLLEYDWFKFKIFESSEKTEITVATRYHKNSKKRGIEGLAFIGSRKFIDNIKTIFDLITLHLMIFCCLIAFTAYLIISQEHLKSKYFLPSSKNNLTREFLFVFLIVIGSTHVIDGISSDGLAGRIALILPRVGFICGLITMYWPTSQRTSLVSFFFISLFVAAIPQWVGSGVILNEFYRWSALLVLIGALFFKQLEKKRLDFIFLLAAPILDTASFFGFVGLSSGSYFMPYTLPLMFVSKYVEEIEVFFLSRRASQIISQIRESRVEGEQTERSLEQLLTKGAEQLHRLLQCKVSILLLSPTEPIVITANKGLVIELPKKPDLPPVFAHVIQTAKPLWWVGAADIEKVLPLKKKVQRASYEGALANIIPISCEGTTYGAVSTTDFLDRKLDHQLRRRALYRGIIESFIDLFSQSIIKTGESDARLIDETALHLSSITQKKYSNSNDETEVAKAITNVLANELDCSALFFSLNPQTRALALLQCEKLDHKAIEAWKAIPFVARRENRASPFAIAVNDRRNLFIRDTASLFGILEERSVEAFNLSNAKCAIIIPITATGSDWGLLMLLRGELGPLFNAKTLEMLKGVTGLTAYKLSDLKYQVIARDNARALSKFIDPQLVDHVAELLKGNTKVSGITGNYFMILQDMRGSSRASRLYSPKDLAERLAQVYDAAEGICRTGGGLIEKTSGDGIVTLIPESRTAIDQLLPMCLSYCYDLTALAKRVLGVDGSIVVAHFGTAFCGILGHSRRVAWDMVGADFNDVFNLEKKAKEFEIEFRQKIVLAFSRSFFEHLPKKIQQIIEKHRISDYSDGNPSYFNEAGLEHLSQALSNERSVA